MGGVKHSDFRFFGYRVTEVSFHRDYEHTDDKSYKVELTTRHRQLSDSSRKIVIEMESTVSNEAKTMVLKAIVAGRFEADPEMPEDMWGRLCQVNAPAVLLPYLRAFISTITVQAGMSAVILPLFNLALAAAQDPQPPQGQLPGGSDVIPSE